LPPSPPEASAAALRLAVPAERAAIEATRQRVLAFVDGLGLSARTVFRLELVLEEMLMNRLLHAFPGDGRRHETQLTLAIEPGALALCFEDDGLPFDPLQAPPRAPPASLAEAVPGGLGLLLTRKAASDCAYERVGGRNRFTVRLARD
jgi:serine/threonine-protein kinase RsbW